MHRFGLNASPTVNGVAVPADDKDWTWVLERRCPECGFDAAALRLDLAGEVLTAAIAIVLEALTAADAGERPRPDTWSPLEYACHVRDTCDVFRGRIALVLAHDNPTFPNWDQDATAVERHYGQQDPRAVAVELQEALGALLHQVDAVPPDAWSRPAVRSNGSRFTLDSLIRYLVHDPVHHAHDVATRVALA